jgi:hypothetical protein
MSFKKSLLIKLKFICLAASVVILPGCDRDRTNQDLYLGLKAMRSPAVYFEFPADNTGHGGGTYTKPTNIGLDLISSLVAVEAGHESAEISRAHVIRMVEGLEKLDKHLGVFPEFIKLEGTGPFGEVDQGKTRYSSLDSAWLHFGLSVAEAYYRHSEPELAGRMKALIDPAGYAHYVQDEGKSFRHGVTVSTAGEAAAPWDHKYDNLNSEARVVLAYLTAAGKVPRTVWDSMFYRWTTVQGLPIAEGWHMNAFVEMSGNVYFDEMKLAPKTLSLSHRNYLKACQIIADNEDLVLYGWAPCFNEEDFYSEYGLDRTEVATPYAAALLTTFDDRGAWENFRKMLKFIPSHTPPRPLPDALSSKTGEILNKRALSLDQNLLYHAVNKDIVRRLVARTDWYPRAAELMKGIDERHGPTADGGKTQGGN